MFELERRASGQPPLPLKKDNPRSIRINLVETTGSVF